MDNTFNQTNKAGKRGERLVADALRKKGNTVDDVSNDIWFQTRDIDFIISRNGQTDTTLEVKNDIKSNYTGNVFAEDINYNNKSRNYKGWLHYCEANYICFVQEQLGLAHIVAFDELCRNIWSGYYRQGGNDETRGFLIPIEKLKKYKSYYCFEVEKYVA